MRISSRFSAIAVSVLLVGVTSPASALIVDFNSGDGGFTVSTPLSMDGPWTYGTTAGAGGSGGWYANGQSPENNHANTTTLLSPVFTLEAASSLVLSFDHIYSFEGGLWDGGQVRLRVNGGDAVAVSGASFTSNGYNGTVLSGSASVLAGQAAFVENSPGYPQFISSVASLGNFAIGDTVQIEFLFGSDTNTSGSFNPDWAIDNFSLNLPANSVPIPATMGLLGIGLAGLAMSLRRKQ